MPLRSATGDIVESKVFAHPAIGSRRLARIGRLGLSADEHREASGSLAPARRAADKVGGRPRVHEYLAALMASFGALPNRAEEAPPDSLPEKAFDILTNREFCYLSNSRVLPYRAEVLRLISNAIRQDRPMRFYFDIGGGYHASLRPGHEAVSFDVGIAELFVLRQIRKFSNRITAIYPPGVRFWLVIDNLCAHLINDIAVANTLGYCTKLRELIRAAGMDGIVDLLVESERTSVDEFARLRTGQAATRANGQPTEKEHANVERFLGRVCDSDEASARLARYQQVVTASEQLLTPFIDGVHMTQRASPTTLCFRPFPGGDSRIQSGEVALRRGKGTQLTPVLLTSRNVIEFDCHRDRPDGLLPNVIPHVTYAVPVAEPAC